MQVLSNAECSLALREHSAILQTCIKPPPVFRMLFFSVNEWPLKTGLTVQSISIMKDELQEIKERCTTKESFTFTNVFKFEKKNMYVSEIMCAGDALLLQLFII